MNKENKRERKELSSAKKLCILAAVILGIFTAVNLFWVFSTYIPYTRFTENMERIENKDGDEVISVNYEKIVDGCRLTAKVPVYLDFSGHLSATTEEPYTASQDDEGNILSSNGPGVTVYIWPPVFGNYKFGVFVIDDTEELFMQVYVDENLNFIPNKENKNNDENTAFVEKTLAENHEKAEKLMNTATEFWNIGK